MQLSALSLFLSHLVIIVLHFQRKIGVKWVIPKKMKANLVRIAIYILCLSVLFLYQINVKTTKFLSQLT